MWSILVITCIIFQSSVAIFLLNRVRTDKDNDFDKYLKTLLRILVAHLTVKFLLLAVLKDMFLYAQVPSGFSFAYGPLLLIIARKSLDKRRMPPIIVFYHFLPFLLTTIIYLVLVIAGATRAISHTSISGYAAWYQWLAVVSQYGYPLYIKYMLRSANNTQTDWKLERQLVSKIANVLLVGISTGFLVFTITRTIGDIDGFDIRLAPYMCMAAIPVMILRYRMTKAPTLAIVPPPVEQSTPIPLEEIPIIEEPTPDRRYEKSGIDEEQMNEYEIALTTFMKKSKIYLDADLSLEQLASKMKMPKHHLTQLLNERLMKSFYNYVNEFRINEAIERLNNPATPVNILSLAFDCGFNSRSSFNNYFKKITGHTPSAYRKQQSGGQLNMSPLK